MNILSLIIYSKFLLFSDSSCKERLQKSAFVDFRKSNHAVPYRLKEKTGEIKKVVSESLWLNQFFAENNYSIEMAKSYMADTVLRDSGFLDLLKFSTIPAHVDAEMTVITDKALKKGEQYFIEYFHKRVRKKIGWKLKDNADIVYVLFERGVLLKVSEEGGLLLAINCSNYKFSPL